MPLLSSGCSIQFTQLMCRRLLVGLYSLPCHVSHDLRKVTGWQGHTSFLFHPSFASFDSRMPCLMVPKQLLGFKRLQVFSLLSTALYFVLNTRQGKKKSIKEFTCCCCNGFTVDSGNSYDQVLKPDASFPRAVMILSFLNFSAHCQRQHIIIRYFIS